MELLQEHGAILKVVIMPTTGEQTIIQGFDTGLLNPEISNILFYWPKHQKKLVRFLSVKMITFSLL